MADEAYVNIEFDMTPEDMAASVYEAIQSKWPEWEPSDANLETWLVDAFSRLMSEVAVLGSRVALSVFQRFGTVIVGIPPTAAASAQAASTWTMVDDAGYTIEAGTEVVLDKTGDERHAFEVVADVVVPPGSTATAAGAVLLRAVIEGEDANDIPSSTVPSLLTAIDYVDSIALTEDTGGGDDGESEAEYTGRLIEELRLMAPRPIVPRDFETFARRHPDVFRVTSIDNWDGLEPGTVDNERMIGLVAIEEDGTDLNSTAKDEIVADLEARREVNFVVNFGEPTFTPVFVTAVVRAYASYDAATVEAAVAAAIEDFLSPQNWGVDPTSDVANSWTNEPVLRYTDLVALVENVPGVDYVEDLFVGTATAPAGTVDVNLPGRVPLTQPATTGTSISVTANEGS